jgi:hypothetical protein
VIEKNPWSIVAIVHGTDGLGFFLFSIMLVLDLHRAVSAPPTTPLPYPSRRTQASFCVAMGGEAILFVRHWIKSADPSVEKHMHGLFSVLCIAITALLVARLIWRKCRNANVLRCPLDTCCTQFLRAPHSHTHTHTHTLQRRRAKCTL